MMKAPDELKAPVAELEERQTHQRRGPEIEAPVAIRAQEGAQPLLLVRRREPAPGAALEGDLELAVHHLDRLLQPLPMKRGPKRRVAIHDLLPCLREDRHLQLSLQAHAQLHHVDARVRGVQAVKEHALLDRRQGVDGLGRTPLRARPAADRASPGRGRPPGKSDGVKPPTPGDRQWRIRPRSASRKPVAKVSMVARRWRFSL